MSITLYSAPNSSALPVAFALRELDMDLAIVELDLASGGSKTPEMLALNPMGQVPTLVDDGHPMFEGAACVIHLGEKYGVAQGLWPEVGSPAHMQALSWLMWGAVSLLQPIRMCFFCGELAPPEMKNAAVNAAGLARIESMLAVLDGHLSGHEFLTGEGYTLADAYVASVVAWSHQVLKLELSGLPEVGRWVEAVMSRPAARDVP